MIQKWEALNNSSGDFHEGERLPDSELLCMLLVLGEEFEIKVTKRGISY